MADLSDFKRCQIVSVRMAGPHITTPAEVFGIASFTVLRLNDRI